MVVALAAVVRQNEGASWYVIVVKMLVAGATAVATAVLMALAHGGGSEGCSRWQ